MKSFKTMWRNVRRSPYQALAAVLIMMLTFLVVSFFTFLLTGSSKIINFFESKPQVTAFFKNEAKQSEMYTQQNKDDPLLLDLVTADILPASLEISAVRIEDLSGISDLLKS